MKKKYNLLWVLFLSLSMSACSLKFNSNSSPNKDDDSTSQTPDNSTIVNYCDNDVNACASPVAKTEQTYNPITDDLTSVYNRTVKSTVTVLSFNSNFTGLSSGSGVIYGTSSDEKYVYIYTNAHVINNANAAYFEIIYYNNTRVSATVLVQDGEEDVAVLQADREPTGDYLEATIGNSDGLKIGQTIFAIGSPLGTDYRNTMTQGIISGLNVAMDTDNDDDGTETRMYLIQTYAALSSGNSGGPMFNLDGQFIGINTLKLTKSGSSVIEGFNFSIPSNHFVKVATELLKDGSYVRPLIGVQVVDIGQLSLHEREKLGIETALGLYIDEIVSGGACDGKIVSGRIITKINSKTIASTPDFISELYKFLPGDVVTISTVDLIGNDPKTVEITLK